MGAIPETAPLFGGIRLIVSLGVITPAALVAWGALAIVGKETQRAKYALCEGIAHTLIALIELTLIKSLLSDERQAYFATSRPIHQQHAEGAHTLGHAIALRIIGPVQQRGAAPAPEPERAPESPPPAPLPQIQSLRERLRRGPLETLCAVLQQQGVSPQVARSHAERLLANGLLAKLGVDQQGDNEVSKLITREFCLVLIQEWSLTRAVRSYSAAAELRDGGAGGAALAPEREAYDEHIRQIASLLETGELRAEREIVFRRYPELEMLIGRLGTQQEFNRLLGHAFFLQERRFPRVLLMSRAERVWFSLRVGDAGIDGIEAKQQERLEELRQLLGNREFVRSYDGSNDGETVVRILALQKRLEDAGCDPREAMSVLAEIRKIEARENELKELLGEHLRRVEEAFESHPALRERPDRRAWILATVRNRIEEDIAIHLGQFDLIQSGFQKEATRRKWMELTAIVEGEEDEWHFHWRYPIQKELMQGIRDSGEALGEGVCKAVVTRLMLHEMRNPELHREELLREVAIFPRDRIAQAHYQHQGFDADLKKWGIESFEVFFKISLSSGHLFSAIQRDFLFDKAPRTQGVLGMILQGEGWAHAVCMRIDHENHVIHFFDPNLGMSKNFYTGDAVVNVEEMIRCFEEHLNKVYPGCKIFGFQYLLPQGSGGAAGPA